MCDSKEVALVYYEGFTKLTTPKFSLNGLKSWVRVVDVYDGDTITVVMHYNNNVYQFAIRLLGIDAPEIRSRDVMEKQRAILVRDRLFSMITGYDGSSLSASTIVKMLLERVYLVWLDCHDFDAFGRILGDVYLELGVSSLSDELLKEGLVTGYR